MMKNTRVLSLENISKRFGSVVANNSVNIDLYRGEVLALLGENGAGKTTTFYMLAGLLPADEGQVLVDGRDVTGMPIFQRARLGMGYPPQ